MKIFDSMKLKKPQTSVFDLSHEKKLSTMMGMLIPTYVQECLPGDTFNVSSEVFMRLAPMVSPMMHRCDVTTHFFWVPNRLIWDEWEDFITGGADGTLAPVFPKITINETNRLLFKSGTLADYLGIPDISDAISGAQTVQINALPFRAYQLIYDEYYRDQNLTAETGFSRASGAMDETERAKLSPIKYRAWEKDYFTSALPWAQRGAEAMVTMDWDYADQSVVKNSDDTNPSASALATTSGGLLTVNSEASRIENIAGDIEISVNALRTAVKLQEWLEKNARGGSRYVEQILSHFFVRSSDARLQRPEYLGGGKQTVQVSEVLNTSSTASEPQGNMSGHGLSIGKSNRFYKKCEEHGYIIGIMSVLPRTAYQQGLEKIWRKFDKFDYAFPEFANLGEQEINTSEIFLDPAQSDNFTETFGYQSRYAEYKYKQSSVHGDFTNNLDHWHLGRVFSGKPSLNTSFVTAAPSLRVFAVQDGTHTLYCQIYNNVKAVRPLPYHNIPSLF